jgi:hypothetical protein
MSPKRITFILSMFVISVLLIALQAQRTVAGSAGCAIPPANMIGWWPGDENANDFLSIHEGTLGAEADFAPGYVREAFNLDGIDDHVSVLDSVPSAQLDGFTELTIDAWIYHNTQLWQDGPNFINAIVSKYNTTMADGASYYLMLYNDNLRIAVFQSVSPEIWAGLQSTVEIPTGEWSHVAGIWQGGTTFELYVNGFQVSGSPISGGSPGSSMTMAENDVPVNFGRVESFGGSSSGPSAFYHGLIDEVEIFDRALTTDEIQAIYGAGSVGKCTSINFLPIVVKD